MRYKFNLILICLAIISLYRCNAPEPKYKIGFSQCESDEWRDYMHYEMQRELIFHPELELEIKNANSQNELQIEHIQEFIDDAVDVLIVSPNELEPITAMVEKAMQAGIPVIVLDRRINSDNYSAFIGGENFEIGKAAGEYVSKRFPNGAKILEIWQFRHTSAGVDRGSGLRSALDESYEIVENYENWPDEVVKKELSEIADLESFDLIFGHNDRIARAASQYLDSIGNKETVIIGVDGLPGVGGGIEMVNNGILDATFIYQTGGDVAIRMAADILKNAPVDKETLLPTTQVDQTNIRLIKQQTDILLTQQSSITRQQEKIDAQIQIARDQEFTLWFISAGLILSVAFGAFVMYSLTEKQKVNKQLQMQNEEINRQKNENLEISEKFREATQAKMRFFTNISHEFRTPITLIRGPIDIMLADEEFSNNHNRELILVRKNVYRLLRLVNQLMDYRKVENDAMEIQIGEYNLVQFVQDICDDFGMLSKDQGLELEFSSEIEPVMAWFDTHLLDKVVFNALSNAFKFTKMGGKIKVVVLLELHSQKAKIEVEDNGVGMSAKEQEQAFDRFYQGEKDRVKGSGVGLALSKEFMRLMHGEIEIASRKGVGTHVSIELQTRSDYFDSEQINFNEISKDPLTTEFIGTLDVMTTSSLVKPQVETGPIVLVVEDNRDLLTFLSSILSREYHVVTSRTAEESFNIAVDQLPDIVISDVMLAGQSGMELTKNIREDFRTSHIPIIMLTALTDEEHRLEGIVSGANQYINKPFSVEFLMASIKMQLKNLHQQRNHYSDVVNEGDEVGQSLDQKFINAFKEQVKTSLSNSELTPEEIAKSLGVSRVQLYRKVKALMGTSVNDYLVDFRLNKARHLLRNSGLTVAQIAYEVGFNSATYFATVFKNKFNITPTEFKDV